MSFCRSTVVDSDFQRMNELKQELKTKQAELDGYFALFASVERNHTQLAELTGGYTSLACEIAQLTESFTRSVDAFNSTRDFMQTVEFTKEVEKEKKRLAKEYALEEEKMQADEVWKNVEAAVALKLEQSESFDDYENKIRKWSQIQANTLMYCSNHGFNARSNAVATYSTAYMLMQSTQREGYWWIKLSNSEPQLFPSAWIYPIVE